MVQEWKRDGLFKKKYGEATIRNLNPYTETLEMRTFSLDAKPSKISAGLGAYYGIDPFDLKPHFIIGGGVQLSLFRR